MDGHRSCLLLLVLTGLLGLSGASCPNMVQPWQPMAPPVLPTTASLQQIIQVVNQNNSQIQSYSANQARLSGSGFPTLRANLAFERPQRFRLRAETGLTGPELDLGSNDQLFWFWVKRDPNRQPPGIYYCRHDQFAASPARQMIPIDPALLIEALGTAEIDPSLSYQGPFFSPTGDRVEIRSVHETATGPVTKAMVIDAQKGWVVEQSVFDAQGRLLAKSTASRHRRDPLTNLVMPSVVEIVSPPAQFSLHLDLGNVQINRLSGNPAELWTMPYYAGSPMVDLCNPNGQAFPTGAAAAAAAPTTCPPAQMTPIESQPRPTYEQPPQTPSTQPQPPGGYTLKPSEGWHVAGGQTSP